MAEDFGARMRRLRREPEPAAPEGPTQQPQQPQPPLPSEGHRGELPVWLRRKLGKGTSAAPAVDLPHADVPRTTGEPERLVEVEGVVARETLREVDSAHGGFVLREVEQVSPETFALLTGDEALADLDPRRAVYLDTETSGLAGGVGTYVYMVGLGRFVGERFEVWQGFLRGPEEEPALLAACAERIGAADTVVSFFGKSFDRHRLEDKMRAHGVTPTFDRPHLDLYHPLARMKGQLPDGRLNTMERELCGFARVDDLPGAFAPAAWFDYLAGRPHCLEGVFQHNLDDVLSLVTLTAHLGRVEEECRADGADLAGSAAARARAVGRAYLAAGQRGEALPWLDAAVERSREEQLDCRDLELERAEALRREGAHDEAAAAYAALVAEADDLHSLRALVGWAMLLEHGRHDRAGARTCCERALLLNDRLQAGAAGARMRRDLEHRAARLSDS